VYVELRERLKVETRLAHERLEARLNLMRPDFRRDDLLRLLERFYGYYAPCEAELELVGEPLRSVLAARVKRQRLEDDLRALGHTGASLAALPRCRVPAATMPAAALGRWYVFEGATLGGQHLAAQFAAKFGLQGAGCSFFRPYGDEAGTMWRAYCQLLGDYANSETDGEAVASANRTFESLESWLCADGPS
jgi:heme oxygenase